MTEVNAAPTKENNMPFQSPTIGRIVRYHPHGSPVGEASGVAAIVTQDNDNGTISLCAFYPKGVLFHDQCSAGGPDADSPTEGCWTWPPRT